MSDSPVFHVVVCAAILNKDKKVLLARRKPEKKLGGYWEFPGGKLEENEDLESALSREIKEEMNLEIENIALLHVEPFCYDHGRVLILFYTADAFDQEPELNDHDVVVWCHPNQIQDYKLLPANSKAIQKLKTFLNLNTL